MQRRLFAAVAAALTIISGGASAHAYITGTFAGAPIYWDQSGWQRFDADPIGVDLAPGTSQTWTFTYSLTLHTDGLPALRDSPDWIPPGQCPSIPYGIDCGPAITGFETAQFDFGLFPPRDASGYWNYTESGAISGSLSAPSGGTATFNGSFMITETATTFRDSTFGGNDRLYPWNIAFADVAPVPEVPPGLMFLFALGLLRLRRPL